MRERVTTDQIKLARTVDLISYTAMLRKPLSMPIPGS